MASATASNVTQRELTEVEWMEPLYSGGYVARTDAGHAWRCDGCGLVWDRRHYAVACASRQHASFWMRQYGYSVDERTGKVSYSEAPVYSLRREARNAPRLPDDPALVALKQQREQERIWWQLLWDERECADRDEEDLSAEYQALVASLEDAQDDLLDQLDRDYDREVERQLEAEPNDLVALARRLVARAG